MREIKLFIPEWQDFAKRLVSFQTSFFKELDERTRNQQLSNSPKTRNYLTRQEIAKHLRRSLPTLDKYVKGGLPSKLVGGKRLFDIDEVEAYFEQKNKSPRS